MVGHTGFIGSHLTPHLQNLGHDVVGFCGDVTQTSQVLAQIQNQEFDIVFFLAGISDLKTCLKDPAQAFTVNASAPAHFLWSLGQCQQKAMTFVFTSSALVYNPPPDRSPITEKTQTKPQNLYGLTKLIAEEALKTIASQINSRVIVLRLFNHTHKSQPPKFFLPSVYHQMLAGNLEIEVGNVDIYRDMGSLSDLIQALSCLLDVPATQSFEIFNICSGQARHLRSLIFELATQLNKNIKIKPSPQHQRSHEPEWILGDGSKFQSQFHWHPQQLSDAKFIEFFLKDPELKPS